MDNLFERRVAQVLPGREELARRIDAGPIRVYLGIDPTGRRLHIGHAIGIKKLMEFAEAGHEAIMLFGTGTVMVGDPSLRSSARAMVTDAEIAQNISTWKQQVEPIVDFDKITIRENGEWIKDMHITQLVEIASKISAQQLFKRESFTRRIKQGDTVWYHETMYPLLQGYDSVVLDVDLEIGGTDQEFNMLMGRELQRKINDREKFVLTTPMIVGTDGQQMSKTSGNCVWLDDSPDDMLGKLMSVGDEQIIPYLELCTDVPLEEVEELKEQLKQGDNPRDIKARMAREITAVWHSAELADSAWQQWQARFAEGQLPKNIDEVAINPGQHNLAELLVETGLAVSKSAARRLIEQGGVRLNQTKVETESLDINKGDVLQAGKRRFIRIK